MNRKLVTALELVAIVGLVLCVLWLGGIFKAEPEPSPLPTPSLTPTGTSNPTTLTPTPTKFNTPFSPNTLTPAPPTPTFPPRTTPSGLIAFESTRDGNSEIYVMNADGSNPHNLTNNPADDFSPVWSPNGKQIAFFSIRSKWQELYVMNADGSQVRQLTDSFQTGMFYQGPVSWSPDGRQILALHSRMWAGHKQYIPDLDVIQTDGSGARLVLEGAAYLPPPIWLPDSQHIATISTDPNTTLCTLSLIALTDPSTQSQPLLSHCLYFAPSPDKTHLAFGSHSVYILDINNPKPQVLPGTINADGPIYWSPDGQYIVYLTNSDCFFRATHANGSGAIPFELSCNFNGLSWAPDSQWFTYEPTDDKHNSDVFIINLFDFAHPLQLTRGGNNYAPVWQPNP